MRAPHVITILLLIGLSGCVTEVIEAERYAHNCAPHYLSPRAKRLLSKVDRDRLAHLIAHVTPKPILAISGSKAKADQLVVTVGYKKGNDHEDFGFYDIEKQDGRWVIVLSANSLDPLMVGWVYDDP